MPTTAQADTERIVIPRSLRRPIKVRISDKDSGRLHEFLAHTPLRVGAGHDCDVQLAGEGSPDTLFELLPVDGPTKLSVPARFRPVPEQYEVSIDGQPLQGDMQELRPGTRVNIRDRTSSQHVDLIVDEPRSGARKKQWLGAAFGLLLFSAMIYGAYLFRSIDDTNERISQTEMRLTEAESRSEKINHQIAGIIEQVNSSQIAVGAALDEVRMVQRRSQRELKADFEQRMRQITAQSQLALSNLAKEDTAGRQALAQQTNERVNALQQEISGKLVDGIARFKTLEEQVYQRHAAQIESLAVKESRFKRVLPVASKAVLYVRSQFTAIFTTTGETRSFDSSGTAFLVSENGLAIAPLHVLEPWRFDEDFLALRELGVIELEPHSVTRHIWLADEQVVQPDSPTNPSLENAFSEDNPERAMIILHKPPLETVTKLVATPLGVIEIQRPMPGPTDLAVFQLIDYSQTYSHLKLADNSEALQPLDEVLVVGYPLGRLDTGRSIAQGVMGSVRRAGKDLLELDTALHPGISGAPVLNDQAQVVGMAVAIFGSVSYGVSVPAPRISQAVALAHEWVYRNEKRLENIGCDPGPVDGKLDQKTWNANKNPGCAFK